MVDLIAIADFCWNTCKFITVVLVLDTFIDIPVIYLDVEVSLLFETCSTFLRYIKYEK